MHRDMRQMRLGDTVLERLEPRILLDASIEWVHLSSDAGDLPVPFANSGQSAALVLDVNNDGKDDFVIAQWDSAEEIAWYRRDGDGWTKYIVGSGASNLEAGGAFHDIDADGDLDLVFGGWYADPNVYWWENPYPDFDPLTPWTRHAIKNFGGNKHHDMGFGDFDGDGSAELAVWNQGAQQLLLFEIPDDPRSAGPWSSTPIYSWTGTEHEGLTVIDVNLDGKADIVGGGRWFEHIGGTDFVPHVINDGMRFSRAAAGQLIAGGRPEIVLGSGDTDGPVMWYEWTGSNWREHTVLPLVRHGHSLDVRDIDADGFMDIFVGEMGQWSDIGNPPNNPDARIRIFHGDGVGNFNEQLVSVGQGIHEGRLGDLDGDGDLDILGKPFRHNVPRLDVWLNNDTGMSLDQWQRHVIDDAKPWRAIFITSGDLDGDGAEDIITGGWWYRNPGTAGGAWERRTIGSPLNNMAAVYDFDGDGDLDVLGTRGVGSQANDDFAWAVNDGAGHFTILTNVASGDGDFLQGVTVDRFGPGGTGPLEVALSWHDESTGVQMLTVPGEPLTETWTWRLISSVSQGEALSSGDIDGDNDADILLGTKWLRNGGDGASWSLHDLDPAEDMPDRNRLVDVNGDGRPDAVVGFELANQVASLAWYEQPLVATDPWTAHPIADVVNPLSVDVADFDDDGDLDVVVGEHDLANPASARLLVFENLDGGGATWAEHLVFTGDEHHDGAHVVDIDGDGDLDVVSIGWEHDRVLLYENKAIDGANDPPVALDDAYITARGRTLNVPASAGVLNNDTDDEHDLLTTIQVTDVTHGQLMLSTDGSFQYLPDPGFVGIDSFTYMANDTMDDGNVAMVTITVSLEVGRVAEGLVVLYELEEGAGGMVADTSGVGAPLDLAIADVGAVSWTAGGLSLNSPTIVASSGPASKILDAATATNELTVEAWLTPANTSQDGPARIATLSDDELSRDFTLGQGLYGALPSELYNVRLRTETNGLNGDSTTVSSAQFSADTRLQHVVFTRDASGLAKLYVDGAEMGSALIGGDFSNWDGGYPFALGNELTGDRPWQGELHLVAVYSAALSGQQVLQNYLAGADGSQPQPGDANMDGVVDLSDLGILATNWGSQSASLAQGDFTGDGKVDLSDLGILATWWSGQAAQPGDANGDGLVDLSDLGILATNWGSQSASLAQGDFTGDGKVDLSDLGILATWLGAQVAQITYGEAMSSAAPVTEQALAAEAEPAATPGALSEEPSVAPAFASVGESLLKLDSPAVDVLALPESAARRNATSHTGRAARPTRGQPRRHLGSPPAGPTNAGLELDFDLLIGLNMAG